MSRPSTYPHVIVRITCSKCPRVGSYRLARLAERFGAEAPLTDVLGKPSIDCERAGIKRHKGSYDTCGAIFPDLMGLRE